MWLSLAQKNIISSCYSRVCFCFLMLPVYQPKLRICMYNLVDHMEAKHKVIPNHHGSFVAVKKRGNSSLLSGPEVRSACHLGFCVLLQSQSILISVFSSPFICMYERALHRWITVFIPISRWFSVVTSGGVIISISKIVTATTYYGNFLH